MNHYAEKDQGSEKGKVSNTGTVEPQTNDHK